MMIHVQNIKKWKSLSVLIIEFDGRIPLIRRVQKVV